jgi:nucleoid-associated protein YgaU
MKFCRVNVMEQPIPPAPPIPDLQDLLQPAASSPSGTAIARAAVEVTGGPHSESAGSTTSSRLDEIAYSNYGHSNLWRLVAWFNNVSDPLRVSAGTLLRIPDLSAQSKVAPAAEVRV